MPYPHRFSRREGLRVDQRIAARVLNLEPLEARRLLAVFNVNDVASLTAAVSAANNNASATNTINLSAGTYSLSGSTGELLVQDLNGAVASKSLTIVGAGQAKTIIDGSASTRVFEIASATGATMSVVIEHLSVSHGNATDGGQLGGTSALGGGILIEGGNVTLSDVAMRSDQANGANGTAGVGAFNGTNGGDGHNARGGAIYLASGSLNLTGSLVDHGVAHAGAGGKGGSGGISGAAVVNGAVGSPGPNGANGANAAAQGQSGKNGLPATTGKNGVAGGNDFALAGRGGRGGDGGDAGGGGIYVAGGQLAIQNTTLQNNSVVGGDGGVGGVGGNGNRLAGGAGGTGGAGGKGGDGGRGGPNLGLNNPAGNGGNGAGGAPGGLGAAGGRGANAGNGGNGGTGGDAEGGAVYVAAGTVTMQTGTVQINYAWGGRGGMGGAGGVGGAGGTGARGGNGGRGGSGGAGGGIATQGAAHGGSGGNGGNGATGGRGGNARNGGNGGGGGLAGAAAGAGVFVSGGTLTITNYSITANQAAGGIGGFGGVGGAGGRGGIGGRGGNGGHAGSGGSGGLGYNGPLQNQNGGPAGNGGNGNIGGGGGNGGNGGNGGLGGNGNNAFGAGIAVLGGSAELDNVTLFINSEYGGAGGPAGAGGAGGAGGHAGAGGAGGSGGHGGTGGTSIHNNRFVGSGAHGGNGGRGGPGGNGGAGGNGGNSGSSGNGGSAFGGSIYVGGGSLQIGLGTSYSGLQVAASGGVIGARGAAGSGGAAGTGGHAGNAGIGGLGGHFLSRSQAIRAASGVNGTTGPAGNGGAPGAAGGVGGIGTAGTAAGSGIYVAGGTVTTAMPATHIGVLVQPPSGVQAGTTFSLQVDAEDSNANTDPTYNGPVSVAIITNPGGGTLSGTLTVNAINGVATFTDLAISQPGNGYKLIVVSPGVNSGSTQAFNVAGSTTGAPPDVTRVLVSGTTWSSTFLSSLQTAGQGNGAGYLIPAGAAQANSLPWTNIDQVQITFSEDVNIGQASLDLSENGSAVATTGFHYFPATFTAVWTLANPVSAGTLNLVLHSTGANAVKDTSGNALDGEWTNNSSAYPSGDGVAGGDFDFAIRALPGDVNGDGIVNSQDLASVSSAWLGTGPTGDVNADGIVNSQDLAVISSQWMATMPVVVVGQANASSGQSQAATSLVTGNSTAISDTSGFSMSTVPVSASSNAVLAPVVTTTASLAETPSSTAGTKGIDLAAPTFTGPLPVERLASFISSAAGGIASATNNSATVMDGPLSLADANAFKARVADWAAFHAGDLGPVAFDLSSPADSHDWTLDEDVLDALVAARRGRH